jgi:hypothetical protein
MFFRGDTPLEDGPRHPGQSSRPAMERGTAASVRSTSSVERRGILFAIVSGEHALRNAAECGGEEVRGCRVSMV